MPVPSVRRGVLPVRHIGAVRGVSAEPYGLSPRAAALEVDGRAGHHGPTPQDRIRRRCTHVSLLN